MREIWREPSGYEGVVLVSNKGRVFKLPQKGRKGTGRYSRDGHLLKQTKINTGYWCVDIWNAGTVKRELVHRLVAKAFVDNPHEYELHGRRKTAGGYLWEYAR